MTDLKIDEKDKVVIRKNHKTGEYQIKELVLHDINTANLLKQANNLLEQLKEGKIKVCESKTLTASCIRCGNTITTFENRPVKEFLPCPKCGVWTEHKKQMGKQV